ncbi:hypothetical protein DPMN_001995 [Dreissena polymorpha]|uniref:Uncharacterized protein n=1 Tax=Dreissena polymorpha TaxID=45954 RepID=A0A9D4MMB1_DREPO|nr:hypothetical protein DPMN_001995 [Dreissena polymorpha]
MGDSTEFRTDTQASLRDTASTTIKVWPKTWPIVTNHRRNVYGRKLYALATLIFNMLKTSNRCRRRTVNANGPNEDHNFPNCSIKTPIGLDPLFSDRGLIGMIIVKSQLSRKIPGHHGDQTRDLPVPNQAGTLRRRYKS